jgi:hypothetical protein
MSQLPSFSPCSPILLSASLSPSSLPSSPPLSPVQLSLSTETVVQSDSQASETKSDSQQTIDYNDQDIAWKNGTYFDDIVCDIENIDQHNENDDINDDLLDGSESEAEISHSHDLMSGDDEEHKHSNDNDCPGMPEDDDEDDAYDNDDDYDDYDNDDEPIAILRSFPGGNELPASVAGIPTDHPIWNSVVKLVQHPRLWTILPQSAWHQWQAVCEPVLRDFITAHENHDLVARRKALLRFYSLPSQVLIRGRGGNQRAKKKLSSQLVQFASNPDHHEHIEQPINQSSQQPVFQPDPDAEFSPDENKAARRAQFYGDAGEYGKAVRALSQQPMVDGSLLIVHKQLADSHRIIPPVPFQHVIDQPVIAIIDPDEFEKKSLPKLCRRSGPDAFGWTGEMIKALFPNEVCKRGYILIMELHANNQLTRIEKAMSIINALLLVRKAAPSKNPVQPTVFNPQPRPPNSVVIDPAVRIRPVTQNALAYKAAAIHQGALLDKEAVAAATGPSQLADVPGGATTAIMKLQAFIDTAQSAPEESPGLIIGVDVKSAFPSQDRKKCLKASMATSAMRPVRGINLTAYSDSSPIFAVQDGVIQWIGLSADGVRQGENQASNLFNLSMAPSYALAVDSSPDVDATAICDDLKLHGEALATINAFDVFSAHIEASSTLELNHSKHEALWPYVDREPPEWLIHSLNERGIPLFMGWMPVLGSAIGRDLKAMASWAAAQVSLNANVMRLITHPLIHPRVALRTLKACIHSKPAHALRALPPSLSHEASNLWDDLTITAVKSIIQLPDDLDPLAQYIISAPCGLGFAKAEFTSVASWLGAQALASKQIITTFKTLTRTQKHNTTTMFELRKAYTALDQFGAAGPLIKMTPASKFHQYFSTKQPAPKLQRSISASVAKARRARIQAVLPRAQALHLKQYSGPGRTAFLSAIATRSELATTPQVFRVQCRNLCAVPLEGTPPKCGLCGMPTTSALHYIDCHSTRSQERLFLHNCITKIIERLTRVAGGQYRTEPRLDDRQHRSRRGDTHLFLPAHGSELEQQIFVDVQCINPLAPSHIASYVNVATALDRAAKLKSRKYLAAAQELNAEFIPFIVTLQGDIGPSAMALLKRLESQAQRPLNIDYRLLLTFAIQRASARAQIWARLRCHASRWRANKLIEAAIADA